MEKISLGLIGCGGYGQNLLRFIGRMDNFEVTAIADPDKTTFEKATAGEEQKSSIGVPLYYGDYREMLDSGSVDAVIIATPNDLHAVQAIDAMKKGISIYLEKPIAVTAHDCWEVVRVQKETNAKVMVGMQLRYGGIYRKAKQLIAYGAIGKPILLWYKEFRGPFFPGSEGWRLSQKRSGGTIVEKNVHHFDLFNWYADSKPISISAIGGSDAGGSTINSGMLDNAVVLISYENGAKGTIGLSLFSTGSEQNIDFVVAGDKGTLSIGKDGVTVILTQNPQNPIFYPVEQKFSDIGHGGTEYDALNAFYSFITQDVPPMTGVSEGLTSVSMALAAQMAISQKREVFLSEIRSEA